MNSISQERREQIYQDLRKKFSDFYLSFDQLVPKPLNLLFNACSGVGINKTLAKNVLKICNIAKDKNYSKKDKDFVRKILLSAMVILHNDTAAAIEVSWSSTELLLQHFPEFHGIDDQELLWMLKFRNNLRSALLFIPAYRNKTLLIDISGRLEGSDNIYILGSGQKQCVTRRESIFNQESGIVLDDPSTTDDNSESDVESDVANNKGMKRSRQSQKPRKEKKAKMDNINQNGLILEPAQIFNDDGSDLSLSSDSMEDFDDLSLGLYDFDPQECTNLFN